MRTGTGRKNKEVISHYQQNLAAHKKYQASAKGQAARKKYQDSSKGKFTRAKSMAKRNIRQKLALEWLTKEFTEAEFEAEVNNRLEAKIPDLLNKFDLAND